MEPPNTYINLQDALDMNVQSPFVFFLAISLDTDPVGLLIFSK